MSMDLSGTNMRALPSEASAAASFFLPFAIPNNNSDIYHKHIENIDNEVECWVAYCLGSTVTEKTMMGYLDKIVAAGDPVFVIEFFR